MGSAKAVQLRAPAVGWRELGGRPVRLPISRTVGVAADSFGSPGGNRSSGTRASGHRRNRIAVRALPEHETRQAHLPAGPDDQIRIRAVVGVEVLGQRVRGEPLEHVFGSIPPREALMEIALQGIDDLLAPANPTPIFRRRRSWCAWPIVRCSAPSANREGDPACRWDDAIPKPRRSPPRTHSRTVSSITSRTAVTSTASRLRFSVESDQSVTIGIPRRAHQVRTSSASSRRGGNPGDWRVLPPGRIAGGRPGSAPDDGAWAHGPHPGAVVARRGGREGVSARSPSGVALSLRPSGAVGRRHEDGTGGSAGAREAARAAGQWRSMDGVSGRSVRTSAVDSPSRPSSRGPQGSHSRPGSSGAAGRG